MLISFHLLAIVFYAAMVVHNPRSDIGRGTNRRSEILAAFTSFIRAGYCGNTANL